MKTNNQFSTLLTQKMSRKDFLKYSGSALLAVIGVTSILNAVLQPNLKSSNALPNRYGNNPYGR